MGTSRCHLTPETQGLGQYGARVSARPMGAPYATLSDGRAGKNCSWTRIERGFIDQVGHLAGGRWCLGEGGQRQHRAGWRFPSAEKRWPQERKPTAAGESSVAPTTVFLAASGVVPCKAQTRRVGRPSKTVLDHLDC